MERKVHVPLPATISPMHLNKLLYFSLFFFFPNHSKSPLVCPIKGSGNRDGNQHFYNILELYSVLIIALKPISVFLTMFVQDGRTEEISILLKSCLLGELIQV